MQFHQSILEALQQPVVLCNQNYEITYVNYAAEVFFGASSAVLCRQKLTTVIATDSPVIGLVDSAINQHAHTVKYRIELDSPRMTEVAVVDVYASPVFDSDDSFAIIFHERTMAEKMDRQLTSRGAARSVTGLAAMLAHEIKNPLSGIRGAAQLLEQYASADDRVLAKLIQDETDRIVGLVDRMAVFGDERPVEKTGVNIHSVLDRVKLVASSGLARGVKITESYDPSLPLVWGNRDQLIQVFLNLVKNAAEATDKSSKPEIKISSAFRSGVKLGEQGGSDRISLPLEIIIEDNGVGIPADILPYLFDPFISTKIAGSGLGLALVAKIVGDHGGVIDCESRPGRTRFRVLLPIAHDEITSTNEHEAEL